MKKQVMFAENKKEALIYPFLFILILWAIWLLQKVGVNLDDYGLLPRSKDGLIGILAMPLLHSTNDFTHIVNNSVPAYCLLAGLIYFYKPIALKVFVLSWLLTGSLLWTIAENEGARHVGFSGMIYALVSFLFVSGMLRKFPHLQILSLLVVFLYGSLVWGIFPGEKGVSWQGHLSGLIVGIALAFSFKLQGPQRKKYQFEIEKEMGIEPVDFEAIDKAKLIQIEAFEKEQEALKLKQNEENFDKKHTNSYFVYTYIPTSKNSEQ
jgi:membrane associated rhomboid family serine protease